MYLPSCNRVITNTITLAFHYTDSISCMNILTNTCPTQMAARNEMYELTITPSINTCSYTLLFMRIPLSALPIL